MQVQLTLNRFVQQTGSPNASSICHNINLIPQATETVPTASQTHPVLVVFDHIDQMPRFTDSSASLMDLLKHPNTHIVVISKKYAPSDALLREIDHQLLRGCNIIDVKPLTMIHTTQRIVHSILSVHHLPPTNEDQNIFEKLARFTSGFPALTDVTAALFLSQMEQDSQNDSQDAHDTLVSLSNQLALDEMDSSTKPVTVVRREPPKGTVKTREISKDVYNNIISIRDPEQDPWCTSSPYDSWQVVTTLIDQCSLSAEERLLFFTVSVFSCSPVPMSVVTKISLMIANATHKPHVSTSLHSKLFQMQLMKRYPLPVILHPSLSVQQLSTEPEFVYVPHYIARAVWKDMMSDGDKVMALTTMYMALCTLADNLGSSDMGFLSALSSLLVELYELNYELMGKQCYQEVYKLYLHIHTATKLPEKLSVMGSIPRDRMFVGRMQCLPSAATPHHPTPAPDTGATPLHPTAGPDTGATLHHPTPAPDTGDTPLHPTPAPDTAATPLHTTPAPDTGATPLHTMPAPDTGATPLHPTPAPDTGATPHHPTPAPDTGDTPLHPTPAPDTGATLHHPTPAPDTGATHLHTMPELYELNYELTGKQCYQEVDRLYLYNEHDPDRKLAALHDKGITSSHLASLGVSEHSTEQGEESCGQSSDKESDEERTLVDNQSPEAEMGSSTSPLNEFSEDSSCESSSGTDTSPPEADDELSSSGSHSTLGRHKRTLPARKRGGTTTPPPDTGATPPHPTPPPDTGATPPHPTPPPDTGATPPQPTPPSDTGATPPHTTPLHRMVSGQQNSKMMGKPIQLNLDQPQTNSDQPNLDKPSSTRTENPE